MMRIISLMLLSMPFVVLSLFGACVKQAPAPEEPKGEILIGILDDLSGPTAVQGISFKDGVVDCIRYLNEEKGGIQGYTLRAIIVDHKLDGNLIISGWDRLKSDGAIIVASATAGAPLFLELILKSNIPTLTRHGSPDSIFPQQPNYFFATVPFVNGVPEWFCKTIENEWPAKGEKRPPKLGFDFVSIGTFPKAMTKAVRLAAEKRGWPYLITRTSLSPIEVTTQVLQMKQFGADYLFLASSETASIAWLKDLERQGLRPVIYASGTTASPEVRKATGELSIGLRFNMSNPAWTQTDVPLIKLLHQLNAKWYPERTTPAHFYIESFSHFLAIAEGIDRALKKGGHSNLNGVGLKEALETITNFETGSGNPYTWTPTDHQGLHALRWYEWTKDGAMVPLGDWYVIPLPPEEQRVDAWWLKD